MKKYKKKILIGAIIVFVLAFFYWWGGNSQTLKGQEPSAQGISAGKDESKGKDGGRTGDIQPDTEGVPAPVDPQNVTVTNEEHSFTLSVTCNTILENSEWFNAEKSDIVPKDGVIFAEKEVTFYEGESVFDLLRREMKKNKIHMEFSGTPLYKSAYIEGIANIYEFDCGELSGWIYKVNELFPSYGCSFYRLKQGDKVEVLYTCDLGADVGRYSQTDGGADYE